jgi:3-phenylpropionate/trans-cinnamate dioxygenase ferredoxin reductase subunit
MNRIPGFVIVGASLAGATAAQTLRDEGFTGQIVLLGDEPHRPYERPPLSKEYLLGKSGREKVFVHPESWYAQHDIDLRLATTVTALDRASQLVTLADGSLLHYDALLLATGSSPRRLNLPGADLGGVLYLRRLEDSEALKSAFAHSPRVVVIGGGWIGLETAAAARTAGLQVTVLEQGDLPLQRVLGNEVAQVFADLHRHNGVDLRCGVHVTALTGTHGHVTAVELADGTQVEADVVLVGVGITPNTGLAGAAGLAVGNGITVDQHLRTADPNVYAAGDVADAYHPSLGRQVRVEHWANARRQGVIAAKSMLGQSVVYDRLPYFFTDQYELGMEYSGYVDADGFDHVVFRGDVAGLEFLAFWLADQRVLAGMSVNVWDVTSGIEQLVGSGRQVDTILLADPAVPIETL